MKHLVYILIIALTVAGCTKKTDDLFDKPSDQRVKEAIDNYRKTLMDAPGWKLFVYPQGLQSQDIEVGGLTYYVTFPDSNRTVMVSDFNFVMAGVPAESSWRLKAMQLPSLLFDTYSYIHVAADPDESVSFSPTSSGGFGWGTDFEFGFKSVQTGDTMRLLGNFNNSDAVLVKATEEEINAAFGGRLRTIVIATNDYATDNPFLYFNSTSSEKIGVSFNTYLYRVNFSYLENGQLVTISAPYSHTVDGIHFKDTVNVGGYLFQDAFWDDAQDIYYINTANGRVNITNSDEPLFPFAAVIGRSVTTITVPVDPLPGQSTTFAAVYDEVANNLQTSIYNLTLDDIRYIFDDESKQMVMNATVTRGSQSFQVVYVFSYQMNSSAITDFTLTAYNANGEAVFNEMVPLLIYIEQDIFKLDYFEAGSAILGQFISQDNPDFFFTGTLQ